MERTNQISIVIPTYNHRRALERCLESITRQTYREYEIIIVDDGSTDDTWNWLQKEKQCKTSILRSIEVLHQNHVVLVRQENCGASAARNRGLKEATGEYVIFCDADVVMRPDMLEIMKQTLDQHPETSYAYSSFRFGWKTFQLWPFDKEKLKQMPYIHSTSLVRRRDFPKAGWDETLKRFQDWDLYLTMLEQDHTGVWVPEILFSITNTKGTMSRWLPSFAYFFPWLPEVKRYHEAKKRIFEKHHV